MGVISPYKTFTFDGESSADYGVYLTGEGVFNAPERSVEMVEIPGRNGNFALDKGRFENISVTYRVGMFDDDEENFADKVSAFRNWLCSKVGYVRLNDDYNPNEYRMAVYSGGVELEHDFLIAGEAQITFDCKPQRWLTSGETAVSVADGGTLDNPTLFESEPLLELMGTGNVSINGSTIDINNDPYGDVILLEGETSTTLYMNYPLDVSMLNIGDTFDVSGLINVYFKGKSGYSVSSVTVTSYSGCTIATGSHFNVILPPFTFTYGTSANSTAASVTYEVKVRKTADGTSTTTSRTGGFYIHYDGNKTIVFRTSGTMTVTNTSLTTASKCDTVIGDSTKTPIGDNIYIDMSIGEAYTIENGEIISANSAVAFGSDLIKLPQGQTTINYDNTITDFKVAPRWWKV